jgi:hypothetical protein
MMVRVWEGVEGTLTDSLGNDFNLISNLLINKIIKILGASPLIYFYLICFKMISTYFRLDSETNKN